MIPYSYSFRNLWTRRLTTLLTASGMGLVVFVFAATLMLAEGLQKTLVATGSPENVIVIRKSANSEVQSGVERSQASLLSSEPEVAIGPDGNPLLSKELVVLINLKKRGSNKPANVVIRGIDAASLQLRPAVHLAEGRMPHPGSAEVIAGKSIARRFNGCGLGETIRFGMRDWRVVGVFDAGATGFSSEIWGDVDQMMQAFRRQVYSSVTFRLRDTRAFEAYRSRVESDPRLTVEAKRENKYYLEQSESMAKFLRILGMVLTVVFSIGAVIGATITMYAAVANRVTEIGTLRALGFQRGSILAAFIMEALLLGLCGGILGVVAASFMQLITISTMNWQSFAELAFSFTLTFGILWKSLVFSLVMGFIGGVLPAFRAARMNIVEALRAT
ncbi:ABC transporter permease [Geomonas sp.]|uniref:ABC transporter permease n=1 Tax=Geomonas sp. TaxID=2651584 RepID=UPI002B47370E|nr:ABC transporter permease [Geomonas sp.]HJV34877.1 ABC transporter permease [Geomonas sp.]